LHFSELFYFFRVTPTLLSPQAPAPSKLATEKQTSEVAATSTVQKATPNKQAAPEIPSRGIEINTASNSSPAGDASAAGQQEKTSSEAKT